MGKFWRVGLFMLLSLLFFNTQLKAQTTTLEAEDASLVGLSVSQTVAGYSGTGYVEGFDADSDELNFTVAANADGPIVLYIGYMLPYGEKELGLYVNDVNAGNVKISGESNKFLEVKVGTISLKKGSNTISIRKGWGWFCVDYIKVEAPKPLEPFNISKTLVTPNASKEAQNLFNFLADNFTKKIISGQQNESEVDFIYSNSGKKPAIIGYDFMDYSPSRLPFGAKSTDTERAIAWWNQGGIVSFSWHWNAPKDLINEPGKNWWSGFYTYATTFDLSKAMNDSTSEEYKLIIRDLDAIAVQLKTLRDNKVPVLWRPLHEASGKWFWWGAKGAQPCMWLYKLMYKRYTEYHKLNNLIWVWTTSDDASTMDWYPGDDMVDILGADIYLADGNNSSSITQFNNLHEKFGGKKMLTMSENGPMADPELLQSDKAYWSWFLTWGNMIEDTKKNPLDLVVRTYKSNFVITLDELPSFKSNDPIPTPDPTPTPKVIGAYPNPATDAVTLNFGNSTDSKSILVYSTSGKKVYETKLSKSKSDETINVSGWGAGIYLFNVVVGNKKSTYKIVVI